MIMLDMEVISFALDSSANQSAATGSEEQIKIRFTEHVVVPVLGSIQLPDESRLNFIAPPLMI